MLTYYPLQEQATLRKVLIVEDDKNINKLMAISIGRGFEVNQIYDGGEAISFVRKNKPDLVILDLMLPHKDGLDICQTIKSDPNVSGTVVILVSAMDPTSNRFKGIKYGADYYIKKPFDPTELRSLVTIFLKKKGKRFDPLIDLPDQEGISNEIEHSIKEGEQYSDRHHKSWKPRGLRKKVRRGFCDGDTASHIAAAAGHVEGNQTRYSWGSLTARYS